MDIGIPRETAAGGIEVRVVLLPPEVKQIAKEGHTVYIEQGAGEGVFVSDTEYKKAGARIEQNPQSIFDKDIVVKLKCPNKQEIRMLRNNILFAMI